MGLGFVRWGKYFENLKYEIFMSCLKMYLKKRFEKFAKQCAFDIVYMLSPGVPSWVPSSCRTLPR